MARNDEIAPADKSRLMRALAFQVHRKRPADEVLREHIDEQCQLGRRREYRAAQDALADSGFVASLQALGMVGEEAAVILAAVHDAKDHRLLAAVLGQLADRMDQSPKK